MECSVHSIALNKIVKFFDGQWQGMTTALNGVCYFGSSTHSPLHGSSIFKFEPTTKKLEILAEDITYICGEDVTKTPPQGKIHSPIVECDGWLYFTTHLSNYWEEAIHKFTGAHVIGYELSSGQFRDIGVVRKGFSIYSAINVDKKNKKLYVFVVPWAKDDLENDGSHLYQIDIETGEKVDLGLVGQKERSACFWFFIDNKGDCWFTLWKNHWPLSFDNGDLYHYDANTRVIDCYKNVLPSGKLAPDGVPAPEKLKTERSWTWAEALPGNKQCLFTMGWLGGGDERLWIFHPNKSIENGEAFQPIAYIGATFLAVAFNQSDRVYFIQYENLRDARTYYTEAIRDYDREDILFNDDLHLRSVSIDPNNHNHIIDHGKIVDQENRHVSMIESLAADDRGNVFMQGSWDALSPDESAYAYIWQELRDYFTHLGYADTCKTYEDVNDHTHKVMHRGQFFSHVNVSEDI
jgi:hypothetical protein